MRVKIQPETWVRHLMVVALYFVAYTALRYVSFSFWVLPAAIRLTCLLLMPYRYWPAMILGEMLSVGKIAYDCYAILGPVLALLKLIPPSLLALPIVYWCRERLQVIGPQRQIRMNAFIFCALAVSLLLAFFNYFRVWISPLPAGVPAITVEFLPRYILGQYLGVLTLAPVALMLWEVLRTQTRDTWWQNLCSSRLAIDSVVMLGPTLALLVWLAGHETGSVGQGARFAMFMPVAALAMRYGWRGAAVGGAAASIAIALAMPALYDPATMQAEVFMALTISTLLMLGARITSLNTRDEKDRFDGRLALQVAQQGLYVGEMRMRRAADTIDQIATSMVNVQGQLLERLRYLLSPNEEKHYSKQLIASKYEAFQLVNSLAPRALELRGLPTALQDATLAHAFHSVDVEFHCDICGDLETLPQSVQLAFYRLVCEAAAYLYEQATLSRAHLRVRVGKAKGLRWVALRMDGFHAIGADDLMPAAMACEQFKNQIGANGLGIGGLRDQAHIYEGTAHLRSIAHGTRLALLLHDTSSSTLNRVN